MLAIEYKPTAEVEEAAPQSPPPPPPPPEPIKEEAPVAEQTDLLVLFLTWSTSLIFC